MITVWLTSLLNHQLKNMHAFQMQKKNWGGDSGSEPYFSLSCDLDDLNKLLFPHPKEAPYEIWLQSARWLFRKSLKILKQRFGPRSINDLNLWYS